MLPNGRSRTGSGFSMVLRMPTRAPLQTSPTNVGFSEICHLRGYSGSHDPTEELQPQRIIYAIPNHALDSSLRCLSFRRHSFELLNRFGHYLRKVIVFQLHAPLPPLSRRVHQRCHGIPHRCIEIGARPRGSWTRESNKEEESHASHRHRHCGQNRERKE